MHVNTVCPSAFGRFQEAWVNFICLQQPSYGLAFQCVCPEDDQYKDIIVDGIELSLQRQRSQLWSTWGPGVDEIPRPGSLHKDRMFIVNRQERHLLRRLFGKDVGNTHAGLSHDEYGGLVARYTVHSSLSPYLAADLNGDGRFLACVRPHVRSFILELISESPVCAVLPHVIHRDLEQVLSNPSMMLPAPVIKDFEVKAPLLGKFIVGEALAMVLPTPANRLLVHALAVAKKCFIPANISEYKCSAQTRVNRPGEPLGEMRSPISAGSMEETVQTGTYFPNRPVVRSIGRYMADSWSQGCRSCTKHPYDTRNLTPGLLVVHCLNCWACLGFHMMPHHESPRTLFDILYTRWAVAPRFVVYDNSCNSQIFFLNREPEWVRDCQFFIDKMHFKGHVGCCQSYNIEQYPTFSQFNSQLAEQRNSRLALLKKQCAYVVVVHSSTI
ncbi:hypothetical protein Vafri_20567 [Volvox africanus]|uniref:CxC5 like cysteine cluster associated with KDZ domain-containing protein n=1 Tax=Volvox africanus TaxID=51714 RepID=A0A8J4BRM6_9CHLO|nr:hypothetical protein Vafri_20567 [Volvox africanus]